MELFYKIDSKIKLNVGFKSPKEVLDECNYTFIHTDPKVADRALYPLKDGYFLNEKPVYFVHCRVSERERYYKFLTADATDEIEFEDLNSFKINI